MVLEELGGKISAALRNLGADTAIDKAALDAVLKDITNALAQSDVEIPLVMKLRANIVKKVNIAELGVNIDKRAVIEKAVREELCALLDGSGDTTIRKPKKGKPFVVMLVGLQGNGKTTTCMKYAHHYKRRGYRPAMVCADTFRAGAYDQLKQNATRAGVPFYGSYDVTDPAEIAEKGVEVLTAAKKDVIIVDTSGRHSQSEALFEEMRAIADRVEPDLTLFVMDATTGQSAGDQARAFKSSVDVGGVIITKMDGSAKGGATLSAVAATKAPVLFIGTGEHMDAFEEFDTKSFVGRLLGKGDVKSLAKKLEAAVPESEQAELMEQMQKGTMTLRLFRRFLGQLTSMGSMSSIMSMLPMFGNMNMGAMGGDKESQAKFRRYETIMDSMSERELDETDSRKLFDEAKIRRVAYGSGCRLEEVAEMLHHYKMMTSTAGQLAKGQKQKGQAPRNMPQGASQAAQMAQLQKALPPQMLAQMQQQGGMEEMMKAMQQMGGGRGGPRGAMPRGMPGMPF